MLELLPESHELPQLHQEHRKITHSLPKKPKDMDNAIQQIYCYTHEQSKPFQYKTPTHNIKVTHKQRHNKLLWSQPFTKQKENKIRNNLEEANIFQQPSLNKIKNSLEIHLPALEKKHKNIFINNEIDNPERRTKIVKIPLNKLKPLNSEEVKKRFLMNFHKFEIQEEE